MHPVRPRFPLQPCGLRHGWNIYSAISSQCFKCGRKGHYARMCRTRNSGAAINVVSSVTTRTFGTQTEEVGKRKSDRKQTRDRDRIKKFNKDRRERNNLREMPFATVNVNEIHSEMIETEIEKYRQQASSKKAEADFLKRDRKTLERQILEKDNTIKRQSEELSAQLDDLAESRIKLEELQVAFQTLQDKVEKMHSKGDQKALLERPRVSYRSRTAPKHHQGQQNPRYAYSTHPCTGSATGNARSYRKHEDVFRGARGYCHRVQNTYFE